MCMNGIRANLRPGDQAFLDPYNIVLIYISASSCEGPILSRLSKVVVERMA